MCVCIYVCVSVCVCLPSHEQDAKLGFFLVEYKQPRPKFEVMSLIPFQQR